MKFKTIIYIFVSFCIAYILIGCQKHMHHTHEAPTEHKHNEKKMMVHNPWVRAVPPVSETSAAYMMLMNHGDKDDQLLSVKSSIAKVVEIPVGKTQELKPGGYHLMLMKLTKTLKVGQEIEFILHFKHSGMVKVGAPVKEGKPMKHDMKHDHG